VRPAGDRRRRRPSRQASALAAPHSAANAYPARGPSASTTNPTTDAPQATPTEMPLLSQDMASVRLPGYACSSSRLKPAMSVGAMVSPHR
jgi:hypothetical protein